MSEPVNLETRIPTLALWLFAKSLLLGRVCFLMCEIKGLEDWILAFASSVPQSSHGFSCSSLRSSHVTSSGRASWITRWKCFPQLLLLQPSSSPYSASFTLWLLPLPKVMFLTYLISSFSFPTFLPSNVSAIERQKLVFYTLFTIWK